MAEPYTDDDVHRYVKLASASHHVHPRPIGGVVISYSSVTRAVLDALAADGRLLPAGGETREEWGLRWPDDVVEGPFASRQDAEDYQPAVAVDVALARRTVTTWPDGTMLTTPWQPVSDGDQK